MPPGLDELLPRFEQGPGVFLDAEAASFVSMFTLEPDPSNVIDLRRDEDEAPSANEILTVLADLGPRPPQRVVDTVAAFSIYGERAAAKAKKTLGSYRTPPSAETEQFGRGTVTSAFVIEEIFDESTQYVLELSYPDGTSGAVVVCINHLVRGLLTDSAVILEAAELIDLVDGADELTLRPVSVGRAAAAIDDAYAMNDQTIGLDELIDDDVLALRPMVEHVLARIPRENVEPTPSPIIDRDRIVADFTEWVHEKHPGVSEDITSWSRLAVDFAIDHGRGDPVKWGPKSVVMFLEWTTRKVMASADELREVPEMMRLFVPWAHSQIGWGDRHVDAALGLIDDAMPIFEEAITNPASVSPAQEVLREALAGVDLDDSDAISAAIEDYNLGLTHAEPTIPPAGGSHPEPFDSTGLGAAGERTEKIAELASVSAMAIFDAEYVTLVRRLTADAARVDPALFARGRPDIWAAGIVYAIAQLNDLIGGWSPLAMYSDELTARLPGAPGTITNKAASIRTAVGADRWSHDPRYAHGVALFDPWDPGFDLDYPLMDVSSGAPIDAHERLPDGSAFVLRCKMVDLPVWRTVRVPAATTLYDLHRVLQRVFHWDDYHLHMFEIAGQRYMTDPDDDFGAGDLDDRTVRLDELLRPGATTTYNYDFGDNWEVLISVEELVEPAPVSAQLELLDGAGDAPPEDCGGVWGYRNLIEALGDPNHPEHAELSQWAGDFRPGSFDLAATAERLRSR